jgi:hypothetical protein
MKVLKPLSALKSRTAIAGIFVAAAFLSPTATASTGGSPEAVVNTAVERTLAALEDAKISDLEADGILELIDVDRVAPFTMGRHWRTMDEATQARFVTAFRQFARGQLREHLGLRVHRVDQVAAIHAATGHDDRPIHFAVSLLNPHANTNVPCTRMQARLARRP